jgi:hypothetical protein
MLVSERSVRPSLLSLSLLVAVSFGAEASAPQATRDLDAVFKEPAASPAR